MHSDRTYRARLVLPRAGSFIDNGAVVVAGQKIVEVDSYRKLRRGRDAETIDLGDVALLPGLVNPHTHLELTCLKGRTPAQERFSDWLLDVMRLRGELSEEELYRSSSAGAEEAMRSGTTCIGAVSNTGVCARAFEHVPIRRIIFHEIPGRNNVKERIAHAEARLKRKTTGTLEKHGIAPHAPYSTAREIYEWSVRVATGLRMPLATHAAETCQEAEFLKTGQGEYREYLFQLGVSLDEWQPPGVGPIQYLAELGFLKACVHLVHCNYVSDDNISLLQNKPVVFCPRSQAYLGHTQHPWRKLRQRGIPVAIGTDSLASNYSLSVLDEMKFLHAQDAEPDVLLEMATIAGAQAMGMAAAIGTLEPGKFADFCAIATPDGVRRLDDIFSPTSAASVTAVGGTIVWRREGQAT